MVFFEVVLEQDRGGATSDYKNKRTGFGISELLLYKLVINLWIERELIYLHFLKIKVCKYFRTERAFS